MGQDTELGHLDRPQSQATESRAVLMVLYTVVVVTSSYFICLTYATHCVALMLY